MALSLGYSRRMQLYVIRHGIAEDKAPDSDDKSRALTDDGRKRVKRVIKGLRELEVKFERILSSPWVRAVETAALLEPLCEREPAYTDLLCQSPRSQLLAMIAEQGADTAIIGHEPWLGELIAWLAFGDTRHSEAISLKKGGFAWLEGNAIPGGMKIRALVPPAFTSAAG